MEMLDHEAQEDEPETRHSTCRGKIGRVGTRLLYLLEFLCSIIHIIILVGFCMERQWIYVNALVLLLMFDIYAFVKVWLIRTNSQSTFWERRFDRCMVGLPVAVIAFYFVFDFSGCEWALSNTGFLRFSLFFAGALSILSVGIATLEIDHRANSDVARDMDKSLCYTIRHLAYRTSEVSFRVSFLVTYCLLTRAMIARGVGYPAASAFLVITPLFALWFVYIGLIMWACRVPNMPRETFLSSLVVGYVAMGPNPVIFMLDTPYHHKTARRANVALSISRTIEFLLLCSIAVMSKYVNYPSSCTIQGPISLGVFPKTKWLISVLLGSFVVHGVIFFTTPRLVHRLFCARGGSQTVPFAPNANGARWRVVDSPSVGLATFLINQGSGSGVLSNLVPMGPVNPNVFRVEKELGQGSYGVVVRVRQDVRGSDPKKFALKLQSTGEGTGVDKSQNAMRTPFTMAMRERDIYRRIWEEVDATTGRLGHPFIVRLLCYSDWPREKELFYENTGEPVVFESVRGGKLTVVSKFDTALIMEYCEHGSLEEYVPEHLRSDHEKDQDVKAGTQYLDMVRRFTAELLIALDFLHNSKSVIYRDLKLDNVFVVVDKRNTSHVKLGDFGFSKVVSDMDKPTSVAGSPYFAAPEMMAMQRKMKRGNTDFSLDVFSLGMVMFCLMHGSTYDPVWQRTEMPHHWQGRKTVHPTQGEVKFNQVLTRLVQTARGVPSAIELIVKATQTNAALRPTVTEMMRSPFFKEVHTERGLYLPALNWTELRSLDI